LRNRRIRKEWKKANPGLNAAESMKRHTAKLRRTPKWLTKEHLLEIKTLYVRATEARLEVDHIVPLQGKNVSGLHVPWNLQLLTKSENRRKCNRF
jgi:5-methylcytosine-specific restriction endonuclease McrA